MSLPLLIPLKEGIGGERRLKRQGYFKDNSMMSSWDWQLNDLFSVSLISVHMKKKRRLTPEKRRP